MNMFLYAFTVQLSAPRCERDQVYIGRMLEERSTLINLSKSLPASLLELTQATWAENVAASLFILMYISLNCNLI